MNFKKQLKSTKHQLAFALEHHRQSEIAIHEMHGQLKLIQFLADQQAAQKRKR